MAKQGNNNTIGEANVRITGDLTDLKGKVAEAKKEVEGIGNTKRGRRSGTIGDDRRSTGGQDEGLSTLATLRRALGIGAFVAGISASFFKLGQALREMATNEKAAQQALEQRSALLELTAEQEVEGLKRLARDLNTELAAFREGTEAERIAYQAAAFARGRPESVVESFLNSVQEQQAQASSRLDRERAVAERARNNALLLRILETVERFADQQKQAADRALAQQQVSAARLEQIIGIRAENARR